MNKKQIISKIKKIEQILAKRKIDNKIFSYNTGEKVHKKQVEFHKCKKRNRWVFGGNRSGKTECGAAEVVYMARGIHPYRKNREQTSGWVVSLSSQVQRDVAQEKVLNYLNPKWIKDIVMLSGSKQNARGGCIDYILVENVFGKISKIGFKNCDQGREKFQGSSLDYVWFDEEPPKEIYDECKMRVLDKKGDIFGTMTPLKGLTFVYNEIFLNEKNDPEVWCEFMEWADNPFLDRLEIEAFTKNMSEEELESRRFGKFRKDVGLVYPEFDESVHVIEPFSVPHEWYDTISIDPGLKNPLSAHFYACDFDGNVYVIAEHYESDRDIDYHSDRIKEICDSLGWKTFDGRIRALIDSAANQKTLASSKSVVELFYEKGILADTRVNKDLFSGINVVKSYLKTHDGKTRLYIFKNCVNMIREFKSYWWGENDNPVKKDDHSMDELRYYLMQRPENDKNKKEKSRIEIDKEKLIRKLNNNRK